MGCGFPAWRVRTECKQPNGTPQSPQSLETTTMEAHSVPEDESAQYHREYVAVRRSTSPLGLETGRGTPRVQAIPTRIRLRS